MEGLARTYPEQPATLRQERQRVAPPRPLPHLLHESTRCYVLLRYVLLRRSADERLNDEDERHAQQRLQAERACLQEGR